MSSQSYSSLSTGKRRGALHDDIDRSVYTVGQTLASIVNDPRTAHHTGGGFFGLGHDVSQAPQAPPLDPAKYPPVTKADVQRYIDLVHGAYDRFIRDRQSLEAFDGKPQPGSSGSMSGGSQSEPFMAAVQAVPMQFFQEGFFDGWDEFFKQYCRDQSADELHEQIDQLNRNLDVVELQLLREVASKSDSFFQAAGSLQHLLGMLGESMGSIRKLRKSLSEADEHMYSTAVSVKALQQRRSNLQATLDITKGLEEVMAAQQALDCLLEAQDYAGALELLDQMKSLLEQPALRGLQCVRHLPPRLVDTTAAVERALANELLNTIANSDVARIVAEAASDAEAQPDASLSTDGRSAGGSAWQLPPATERGNDAAVEQLQEKMLPLAVGLYRSDRLGSTLQQYKASVGDEVKAGVRDAVQQVLPVLLASTGDMTQQHAGTETQLGEQLQLLHHGAFMVLLHAAARVIYSCVDHAVLVFQLLEGILAGIHAPASQVAALRKECSAALQVVVDVGLGRWVKLLATRSAAHTRLKQYELRQLLDLSEQVASYTESLGARTLGTFRSALQGQCKGLLDSSHARAMNQLQHLLESEQWVAVEVPGSFQAIVDRLVARCGEGAALLQEPRTAAAGAGSSSGGTPRVSSDRGAAPAAPSSGVADGPSESHSPTLQLSGKSFHLVNSALMLLKMVDEYMALYDLMPQFGAEIVHRELELLKLFNSQTCALVLGAGAMRTAGLRSISAKQLALSCQAVAMLATLLPLLRAGSLALVSQPRRALLLPEFDRLLQDLTMHMDEVHSKLVDIMRDRLAAATQALPAEVKAVGSTVGSSLAAAQPSPTIGLLVKQLGTLRAVLAPYLLKEEVEFIFGAVARAYSDALSETFEVLMAQGGTYDAVVRANALAMLQAFRDLPLDPTRASNYYARLSTTYTKHFGLPPWDQERLGNKVQQQQQQQQQEELRVQSQEQDSLQQEQQPQQAHSVHLQQLQEQQSEQQLGGTGQQYEPQEQQHDEPGLQQLQQQQAEHQAEERHLAELHRSPQEQQQQQLELQQVRGEQQGLLLDSQQQQLTVAAAAAAGAVRGDEPPCLQQEEQQHEQQQQQHVQHLMYGQEVQQMQQHQRQQDMPLSDEQLQLPAQVLDGPLTATAGADYGTAQLVMPELASGASIVQQLSGSHQGASSAAAAASDVSGAATSAHHQQQDQQQDQNDDKQQQQPQHEQQQNQLQHQEPSLQHVVEGSSRAIGLHNAALCEPLFAASSLIFADTSPEGAAADAVVTAAGALAEDGVGGLLVGGGAAAPVAVPAHWSPASTTQPISSTDTNSSSLRVDAAGFHAGPTAGLHEHQAAEQGHVAAAAAADLPGGASAVATVPAAAGIAGSETAEAEQLAGSPLAEAPAAEPDLLSGADTAAAAAAAGERAASDAAQARTQLTGGSAAPAPAAPAAAEAAPSADLRADWALDGVSDGASDGAAAAANGVVGDDAHSMAAAAAVQQQQGPGDGGLLDIVCEAAAEQQKQQEHSSSAKAVAQQPILDQLDELLLLDGVAVGAADAASNLETADDDTWPAAPGAASEVAADQSYSGLGGTQSAPDQPGTQLQPSAALKGAVPAAGHGAAIAGLQQVANGSSAAACSSTLATTGSWDPLNAASAPPAAAAVDRKSMQ